MIRKNEDCHHPGDASDACARPQRERLREHCEDQEDRKRVDIRRDEQYEADGDDDGDRVRRAGGRQPADGDRTGGEDEEAREPREPRLGEDERPRRQGQRLLRSPRARARRAQGRSGARPRTSRSTRRPARHPSGRRRAD